MATVIIRSQPATLCPAATSVADAVRSVFFPDPGVTDDRPPEASSLPAPLLAAMRVRWLIGLAVLAALAGCIGSQGDDAIDAASTGPTDADVPDVLTHEGDQLVDPPPEAEELAARVIDTGYEASEPEIGVLSDGSIVSNPQTGDESLVISEDDGQSWETIGSTVHNPKANLDPWMHVDDDTDRIYNGPLYVACSHLAWTDDKGASWMSNPIAGCGVPAHDHQKITTGPPAEGVETEGYPNVVYYAYNGAFRNLGNAPAEAAEELDGTWVHTSLDGGQTFVNSQRVFDPSPCTSGINGPVEVGPNGTAYVAHPTCDGTKVAVSHDSGSSWEPTWHVDNGMYSGLAIDADLSTDEDGHVYLLSPGGDGRMHVSVSTNRGTSFAEPVPVSPPGVNMTVFPLVSAGDTSNVAFAYLGTTDDVSQWDRPEPSYAREEANWHLYLTTTQNALADEPTFTTVQLTPDEDPVQRGCIWLKGGGSDCRNLLDFNGMVEHDGRPYIAYTDGCDACPEGEQSTNDLHRVAILEQGPSLDGDVLDPLVDLDDVGNEPGQQVRVLR